MNSYWQVVNKNIRLKCTVSFEAEKNENYFFSEY